MEYATDINGLRITAQRRVGRLEYRIYRIKQGAIIYDIQYKNKVLHDRCFAAALVSCRGLKFDASYVTFYIKSQQNNTFNKSQRFFFSISKYTKFLNTRIINWRKVFNFYKYLGSLAQLAAGRLSYEILYFHSRYTLQCNQFLFGHKLRCSQASTTLHAPCRLLHYHGSVDINQNASYLTLTYTLPCIRLTTYCST